MIRYGRMNCKEKNLVTLLKEVFGISFYRATLRKRITFPITPSFFFQSAFPIRIIWKSPDKKKLTAIYP